MTVFDSFSYKRQGLLIMALAVSLYRQTMLGSRTVHAWSLRMSPSSSLAILRQWRCSLNTNSQHTLINHHPSQTQQHMTTTDTGEATTNTSPTLLLVHGRISRGALTSMGDVKTVTENLPLILSHLKARKANEDTLQAAQSIARIQNERVALIRIRDAALKLRNDQSALVGQLMRNKQLDVDTKERQLEQAKHTSAKAAEEAAAVDRTLTELEHTANTILTSLPNILDDLVPDGKDDKDNQPVETWGDLHALPTLLGWTTTTTITKTDTNHTFIPQWHDDVATSLGGWHSDKAVAISGARFVALSGQVARLERAISSFFLDLHTLQHGYTEVSVPYVVSRTALEGTTQLPKFELDLFKIDPKSHTCNGQDAFLIPTAEVPLTNLHRDSILDEVDLPLSYVALTPCFRAEAGSYGRDTRGLIRTHQFHKVELVKITSAETSDQEHEQLTRHAQKCLELLQLPYRKVRLCSGDIGFSARHCYDLEVWLPGSGEYREISSCSNTGDFQARRMGLRYRPSDKALSTDADTSTKSKKKNPNNAKAKPQFCHTINGSGLAVGRTLVAILENYQLPDGGLRVPDVLVPYMGGQTVLRAVSSTMEII